jgi:hypothetical protein
LRGSQRTGLSQPFPLLRSHQDTLELLTITKKGNTKFSMLTTPSGTSRVTSNHLGAKLQE